MTEETKTPLEGGGVMVSVDESATQGTAALRPEVQRYLDGVVGVVEANRFEQSALWENNRRHEQPRAWKENLSGFGQTVGHVGDMPVFLSLMSAEVGGQKLLFIDATSQLVDHRMIDAWLSANLPASAFWPDGRLNRVDAMNFHNVFRAPLSSEEQSGSPSEASASCQTRDDLKTALEASQARQRELEVALVKINAIRNSIIGLQKPNWSEHIYPLVAALDEAGFEGMEYPEARANYGTMLERTNAAEQRVRELEEALREIRDQTAGFGHRRPRDIAAEALLARQGEQPEGWVLVPREPTQEALRAILLASGAVSEEVTDAVLNVADSETRRVGTDIYRAMIAAAPSPTGGER